MQMLWEKNLILKLPFISKLNAGLEGKPRQAEGKDYMSEGHWGRTVPSQMSSHLLKTNQRTNVSKCHISNQCQLLNPRQWRVRLPSLYRLRLSPLLLEDSGIMRADPIPLKHCLRCSNRNMIATYRQQRSLCLELANHISLPLFCLFVCLF